MNVLSVINVLNDTKYNGLVTLSKHFKGNRYSIILLHIIKLAIFLYLYICQFYLENDPKDRKIGYS